MLAGKKKDRMNGYTPFRQYNSGKGYHCSRAC
ncbi:hypothetical protein MSKU3_0238 [Komagataeibacter oboediens]|nr:hypothetical protein MSKU3_0238 [Komagataeibacter oboediens]